MNSDGLIVVDSVKKQPIKCCGSWVDHGNCVQLQSSISAIHVARGHPRNSIFKLLFRMCKHL